MLEGFRAITQEASTDVLLVCPWGHEIPMPSGDDLVEATRLAETHLREQHNKAWVTRTKAWETRTKS